MTDDERTERLYAIRALYAVPPTAFAAIVREVGGTVFDDETLIARVREVAASYRKKAPVEASGPPRRHYNRRKP